MIKTRVANCFMRVTLATRGRSSAINNAEARAQCWSCRCQIDIHVGGRRKYEPSNGGNLIHPRGRYIRIMRPSTTVMPPVGVNNPRVWRIWCTLAGDGGVLFACSIGLSFQKKFFDLSGLSNGVIDASNRKFWNPSRREMLICSLF